MSVYIHIYASTEIYRTFTALGKYQKLSHIFPLLYGPCSSNHLWCKFNSIAFICQNCME